MDAGKGLIRCNAGRPCAELVCARTDEYDERSTHAVRL
jgi:hypothetical protein